MSDAEKILIVDQIIADFWEWNPDEKERKNGALHVLNAISSVLGCEGATMTDDGFSVEGKPEWCPLLANIKKHLPEPPEDDNG